MRWLVPTAFVACVLSTGCERHAKTDITNDIYAHALPSMGRDPAAKVSSLLR